MLLPEAIALIVRLIENNETHKDYKRVTELAQTYKAMITGMDIEKQLIQVVRREDKEMFEQRVALTKSITPAVAASVRRPFNKVARNDRIKTKITLDSDARTSIVRDMMASFYGSPRKKNKGLDYWLKTRFVDLQFSDPNAWIVMEWDTPENRAQIVKPRPFVVSSDQAVNFHMVNDEVKWLFIKQPITYYQGVPDNKNKRDGARYTLYDTDYTIVFEQFDPVYMEATGNIVMPEDRIEIKSLHYWVKVFQPNIGYAPVFRVGYNTDEATDARTLVNPWHAGLCFFEKMLITVSELDLTIALHTFPQKIQYVQLCPGDPGKKCNKGLCGTEKCGRCKGKGYETISTAQEAIYVPMPTGNDSVIPLENYIVYKAPPIELIKFQNEYTLQLERQVHQAVFNSQVFVKNHYTNEQASEGSNQETATLSDMNMQSVYDTLEPFTEKESEVWKDLVHVMARIANAPEDKIDLLRNYPADFKLKTLGVLMAERKAAKDSGAPAFVMEAIDDDIAAIIHLGDEVALVKFKVKKRYYPFIGKSEEEIASLLSGSLVPKTDKVLYANFETIFREIEQEEGQEFYLWTDLKKQREVVEAKVQEFILRLDQDEPTFSLENFPNPAGGDDPAGGDGNPGEDPAEEGTEENPE